MEIIDQNPDRKPGNDFIQPRNIFLGATLIVIGLLWLFNNFDLIPDRIFDVLVSWQTLLVVIGGFLLAQRKWVSGGIVALVGIVFVATDLMGCYIPVNKVILPVVFIAAGLALILSRLERQQ